MAEKLKSFAKAVSAKGQDIGVVTVAVLGAAIVAAIGGFVISQASSLEALKPIASHPLYQIGVSSLVVSLLFIAVQKVGLEAKLSQLAPALGAKGSALTQAFLLSVAIFFTMWAMCAISKAAGLEGGICPQGVGANDLGL